MLIKVVFRSWNGTWRSAGRPVAVAGAGTTSGRGWSRCCHRYRRRGGRRGIGGGASTGSGGGRGPARRGGTYPSGTGRGRARTRCSAAGRSTEHGLWPSRSCRSRQMPLDTSSGRCPSTPRSAGPQHAAGARKKGLRFGLDGPGRAGSRAGRPRPRTLARRPDHETAPARERLVPRPGDRGHRRQRDDTRCSPRPWNASAHPGRAADAHTSAPTVASGPRVLPPPDPRVPAPSADRSHHPEEARPGRTPSTARQRARTAHMASTANSTNPGTRPNAGSACRNRLMASRHVTTNSPSTTRPPSNSP